MEKKALSPSSPTSSSSPSSLASSAFSRGDYKNAADLLLTSDSEVLPPPLSSKPPNSHSLCSSTPNRLCVPR